MKLNLLLFVLIKFISVSTVAEDSSSTTLGEPGAIRSFGGSETQQALDEALKGIPDASGILKVRTETRRESFEPIYEGDLDIISVLSESISGTYRQGNVELTKNDIKTRVSWTTNACVCLDWPCSKTGLIDFREFGHQDDGEDRDISPLLLFNTTSGDPLSCLSLATKSYDELDVQGCAAVDEGANINGLLVRDCMGENVENLRFLDKETGRLFARPLSGDELLPDNAGTSLGFPQQSFAQVAEDLIQVEDNVEDLQFNIEFEVLNIPFSFPITVPIANQLETATRLFLTAAFDSFTSTFRPQDFSSDNPGSQAAFADILRVLFRFDLIRLVTATRGTDEKATNGMRDSVLVREVSGEVPETSQTSEIIGGIVLLFLTSCFLGSSLAALDSRKQRRERNIRNLLLGCVAAGLAVAAEATAYALRWQAEKEKKDFVRSVTVVDLVGGGRFNGIAFLRVGRDFDPFMVTVYNVEVSDASNNRELFFLIGVAVAGASLLIAFFASIDWENTSGPGGESLELMEGPAQQTSSINRMDSFVVGKFMQMFSIRHGRQEAEPEIVVSSADFQVPSRH